MSAILQLKNGMNTRGRETQPAGMTTADCAFHGCTSPICDCGVEMGFPSSGWCCRHVVKEIRELESTGTCRRIC